jgi:hypothetical protein
VQHAPHQRNAEFRASRAENLNLEGFLQRVWARVPPVNDAVAPRYT